MSSKANSIVQHNSTGRCDYLQPMFDFIVLLIVKLLFTFFRLMDLLQAKELEKSDHYVMPTESNVRTLDLQQYNGSNHDIALTFTYLPCTQLFHLDCSIIIVVAVDFASFVTQTPLLKHSETEAEEVQCNSYGICYCLCTVYWNHCGMRL